MGWSNWVVLDDYEIRFEISRNVRTDEIEEITDKYEKLWKDSEDLTDDIKHEELSTYNKTKLMNMGFNLVDMFVCGMEPYYLLVMFFLMFLKERGIKYRILSDYDLESDKAKEYKEVRH